MDDVVEGIFDGLARAYLKACDENIPPGTIVGRQVLRYFRQRHEKSTRTVIHPPSHDPLVITSAFIQGNRYDGDLTVTRMPAHPNIPLFQTRFYGVLDQQPTELIDLFAYIPMGDTTLEDARGNPVKGPYTLVQNRKSALEDAMYSQLCPSRIVQVDSSGEVTVVPLHEDDPDGLIQAVALQARDKRVPTRR